MIQFLAELIFIVPDTTAIVPNESTSLSLIAWFFNPFWQGVISGLISSAVFLLFVYWFVKPNIIIAPNIALSSNPDGTDKVYRFKIVNNSRYRAFDIKISLQQVSTMIDKGNHVHVDPISLRGAIREIPFLESKTAGKRDPNGTHACRFGTNTDIEAMLGNQTCYIELQIIARHGMSGLPRVFSKRFDSRGLIKKGTFGHGSIITVD